MIHTIIAATNNSSYDVSKNGNSRVLTNPNYLEVVEHDVRYTNYMELLLVSDEHEADDEYI